MLSALGDMIDPVRALVLIAVLVALAATAFAARPLPETPADFALDGDLERGKVVFERSCAPCHGATGDGNGSIVLDPPARDFGDVERMGKRTDWEIYLVIRDGGKVLGLSRRMMGWRRLITAEELLDVATLVRSMSVVAPSTTVEAVGEEPTKQPRPDG